MTPPRLLASNARRLLFFLIGWAVLQAIVAGLGGVPGRYWIVPVPCMLAVAHWKLAFQPLQRRQITVRQLLVAIHIGVLAVSGFLLTGMVETGLRLWSQTPLPDWYWASLAVVVAISSIVGVRTARRTWHGPADAIVTAQDSGRAMMAFQSRFGAGFFALVLAVWSGAGALAGAQLKDAVLVAFLTVISPHLLVAVLVRLALIRRFFP